MFSRVEVKTGRPGNVDVAELEVIMQEVQLDFARAMNLGILRRVFHEMQCKIEQSCRIESVFFFGFAEEQGDLRYARPSGLEKIIVEANFEESLWRPGW